MLLNTVLSRTETLTFLFMGVIILVVEFDIIFFYMEVVNLIVDWIKHCYKIDDTHRLDRDDPSDNKIYFKQEVTYIRFLINRGCDYDQCKENWLALENGVASQFKGDREQLSAQFHKTFAKAKTRAYSSIDGSHILDPVPIYLSEVKRINSLKAPKWVKEYFLVLLIYSKFMSQKKEKVEYSTTLVNWALRQVSDKSRTFRSYRDARKVVADVIMKSKPRPIKFFPIKGNERYTTYSIPFCCSEGDVVATIDSIDDLEHKIFGIIRSDTCVCRNCGTVFGINSKTKRDLCPGCYKTFRRGYKTMKDREYYHRKKQQSGQ